MGEKFIGVIIEESLENKGVIKKTKVLKTKIEPVTVEHQTPWIKQWTLHTVEIPENQAEDTAKEISTSLDSKHNWYADFKSDKTHFIIFRNKVFKPIHLDVLIELTDSPSPSLPVSIPCMRISNNAAHGVVLHVTSPAAESTLETCDEVTAYVD